MNEVIQKTYETGDSGANINLTNFDISAMRAGFYLMPLKPYNDGSHVFLHSPSNVAVLIYEITEPYQEPVNNFRMIVVNAKQKSEAAEKDIDRLLLQLPMFKLVNEEEKVTGRI